MATPVTFRTIELFCHGRLSPPENALTGTYVLPTQLPVLAPDDPNEDRIWCQTLVSGGQSYTAFAVVDGVTYKTPWRVNGRPSGWHAARLVLEVLNQTFSPRSTRQSLWQEIRRRWRAFERQHNCPRPEKLRATLLLFNSFRVTAQQSGELWLVGDCLYGWETADGTWVPSTAKFPANSQDAETRATATVNAQRLKYQDAPRVTPPAPATDPDLHTLLAKVDWSAPVAALNQQPRFRPDLSPAAIGALIKTGWDVMQDFRLNRTITPPGAMTAADWAAFQPPIAVPLGVTRLLLCTDGSMMPLPEISQHLDLIQALAHDDPACIGIPLSTANEAKYRRYMHTDEAGQPIRLRHAKGFIGFDGQRLSKLDDMAILLARI